MNGTYTLKVNDATDFNLKAEDLDTIDINSSQKTFKIVHQSICYTVEWMKKDYATRNYELLINGKKFTINIKRPIDELIAALGIEQKSSIKSGEVTAHIPGRIIDLLVKEGDRVTTGAPIITLEAMKMENSIAAPIDGIVSAIHTHIGETVQKNQHLILIE